MNVATYLRVSTETQNHDPQRVELQRHAEIRGWTIKKEYCDTISGAKSSRSGLDALMRDVRSGKVRTVLVTKIDRLARSMVHFAQIVGEFHQLKVALVIPSQNIDTTESNPAGRLTMNILASIAEFERELIRDRTNAGIAAAKAKGVVFGRPKGPKVIVPLQSLTAAMATGTSINQFARENGFAPSTLRRALKAS
jgi:putative DNA-invertase from lambdoid prophage Rac